MFADCFVPRNDRAESFCTKVGGWRRGLEEWIPSPRFREEGLHGNDVTNLRGEQIVSWLKQIASWMMQSFSVRNDSRAVLWSEGQVEASVKKNGFRLPVFAGRAFADRQDLGANRLCLGSSSLLTFRIA